MRSQVGEAVAAKAVNAQVVTVVNVNPKHPLRVTSLGSKPLQNGDKFRVSTDMAKQLSATYGKFLEVGKDVQSGVSLAHGTWEAVAGGGKSDAGDKLAAAETPAKTAEAVEKPANKDMAGKAVAKK